MQDSNYLLVQGWMITKLKLSGNELLCYALIYGFSQDGNSVFSGTASYIADWLGIEKRSVFNVLQKLVEKGYLEKIEKTINNVKLCDYKINMGVVKNLQGGDEKFSLGSEKTSPHNINDNNRDIKENNIKENDVEIVGANEISSKKGYFTKDDVDNVINIFAKSFRSVDAIVGVFDNNGNKNEGIKINNQRLLAFIKNRFDKRATENAKNWAIDHQSGKTYNAQALLRLLCKFQRDYEPSINFNYVQNEYVDFCEKNKKIVDG